MIKAPAQQHYEVLHGLLRENNILKLNTVVEVGTRHADTAGYLCRNNPNLYMYLVDNYPAYLDCGYQFTEEEQNKIKTAAFKRMENYVVQWLYQPSVKAAARFTEVVDCVFIDAWHVYDAVREDIAAWYPKIRPGGMLALHDASMDGVKKAVQEFCRANNLQALHTGVVSDIFAIEKPV
jgi:predicted O-methyltransferase YrrM